MSLKAALNSDEYESLDESIRQHYVERDGRYLLDVDAPEVFAERPLKALQAERELRKRLERELAEAKKSTSDAPRQDTDAPNVTALLERQRAELTAEIERQRAEAEALRQRLVERDTNEALRRHALDAGVRPDRVDHVLRLLAGRYQREGDALLFRDANGTELPDAPADFFTRRLRAEVPEWYVDPVQPGTGAPPRATGARPLTTRDLERMTPAEINAHWERVREAMRK